MRLDDAFELLNTDASASLEEAQKAYRRAALRHHPDRNPDDPSATSKFQTIGEAWERVQKYHSNPRRWGTHADAEPEVRNHHQPAAQPDFERWEEMYKRWFGGGAGGFGFQQGYGDPSFQPGFQPPRHKPTAEEIAREKRREEIFADREREREERRRAAAKAVEDAQQRAREEAARAAARRKEEELERARKEEERKQQILEKRAKAAEALRRCLERPIDQLPTSLDALLDEFADLKERIDRGVRAKIEEEGTAEERKLLEKANKRLETVAEAAEAAAEKEEDRKTADSAVYIGDEEEDEDEEAEAALLMQSSRRGGTRKQRRAAARGAAVQAMQTLRSARTASELREALAEALDACEGGAAAASTRGLAEAIESAREQLARLEAGDDGGEGEEEPSPSAPAVEPPPSAVVTRKSDLRSRRRSRRGTNFT